MKTRILVVSLTTALVGLVGLAAPAQATPTNDTNPCKVEGWYVNPDETNDAPTRTVEGFLFENKDLIHHATRPIDLPDIKKTTGSFVATVPGKVVFKMETENPYSTVIQNADGKFWSTAMTYSQEGGQGSPVENVSDLIGKDTKPGKAKYGENSHVVTFGVGYWDTPGSTLVTSITFHGTTYDLTCEVEPTKSPTASPTASPTVSPTETPTVSPSVTSSPTVQPTATVTAVPSATTSMTPVAGIGGGDESTSLPVTGVRGILIVFLGLVLVGVGVSIYMLTRRRNQRFIA